MKSKFVWLLISFLLLPLVGSAQEIELNDLTENIFVHEDAISLG